MRRVRSKKSEKPRKQAHLSAAARLEIRDLIHEELAKVRGENPDRGVDDGDEGEES